MGNVLASAPRSQVSSCARVTLWFTYSSCVLQFRSTFQKCAAGLLVMLNCWWVRMCLCMVSWHPIEDVLPPYSKWSQDRLWIHRNLNLDQVLAEDHWMNGRFDILYIASFSSKGWVPVPASFPLVVVRTAWWRNGIALALLQGVSTLKRAETLRCLLLRLHAIQADLLGRLCLHDKGLQRTLNTFPHTSQRASLCP